MPSSPLLLVFTFVLVWIFFITETVESYEKNKQENTEENFVWNKYIPENYDYTAFPPVPLPISIECHPRYEQNNDF